MISEVVLEALRQVCQDEVVISNPDVRLFDTGLLDSFAAVELLVELERRLGVELSPADLDRELWATPRSIISYLEGKLAGK